MRVKRECFVVTFATTTGAMAMEQICLARKMPGRLIPVPRSIRAGCGMCWAAPVTEREKIEALLIEEKMEVDGLYVKSI